MKKTSVTDGVYGHELDFRVAQAQRPSVELPFLAQAVVTFVVSAATERLGLCGRSGPRGSKKGIRVEGKREKQGAKQHIGSTTTRRKNRGWGGPLTWPRVNSSRMQGLSHLQANLNAKELGAGSQKRNRNSTR